LTGDDLNGLLLLQFAARVVSAAPLFQPMDADVASSIEAALRERYRRASQQQLFPDFLTAEFEALGSEVIGSKPYSAVPGALRREILLKAARSAARRGRIAEGRQFLDAALALPGETSDAIARARLAEAENDIDAALRLMRDRSDEDSRSTMLDLLARHKSDAAALTWLDESGVTAAHLTASGIFALNAILLRQGDFTRLRDSISQITASQCEAEPVLLFIRAAARLASTVGKADRDTVLSGIPVDARLISKELPPDADLSLVDDAIDDLHTVRPLALVLGLVGTVRIIDRYMLWCELLHPARKARALKQLSQDDRDPRLALGLVQFAFAFDNEFDPQPLQRFLAQREERGGLNDEELRASFALNLNTGDAKATALFIARYGTRLDALYSRYQVATIEVQALAFSGDSTSARSLFDRVSKDIPSDRRALLQADVEAAEGADAVTVHQRAYESAPTADALRALVMAL
jgi:hypothetical protein